MQKKSRARVLAMALIAIMLLTACGSGNKTLTRFPPDEGVEPIDINAVCEVERNGNTVRVILTSNLMEGTVVKFSIDGYDGTEIAKKLYEVTGGTIYAEFEIAPSWTDIVYGTVTCSPSTGSQPKEVTEAYGKNFQNIESKNLMWNSNENIIVAQSAKIAL